MLGPVCLSRKHPNTRVVCPFRAMHVPSLCLADGDIWLMDLCALVWLTGIVLAHGVTGLLLSLVLAMSLLP